MFDYKNPDYTKVFFDRAERLKNLRKNPSNFSVLLTHYKSNPAQMINDWGCTFDPRNVERGLPAVIPFILFPRQIEWVDWIIDNWHNQESANTVKSRDMGLSWLSVALSCSLSVTHNGMVVGFGSRKEEYVDRIGSPKSLFYKARMFMSMLPLELRGGFVQGRTDPYMRIMFPGTDSAIIGEAGNSIGRSDRAALYFVDEAAFLERPYLVDASLSQTTNCRQDVSTPNGLDNPFAEKVLSEKHKTFRFHWRDDPRKDQAWYDKQVSELDETIVAQEIDIDFSASVENVLIPSAWVQSSIDAHIKLGLDPEGERISALDVADRGKDNNAQAFRNGVLLKDVRQWHGTSVDDIFGTTQRMFDNCDEWGITSSRYDSDGLGAGVRGDSRVINEDRSRDSKIDTIAFHGGGSVLNKEKDYIKGRTNGEFFENLKAQACWSLRMRFKKTHEAVTQGVAHKIDDMISVSSKCSDLLSLQTELSQPTYKKTSRGKLIVNKATNGVSSPNMFDSVMMCYAQLKNPFSFHIG